MPSTLLLVEDDRNVVEDLTEVLEEEGHRIVCTASGLEAVQRVSQGGFDFVLLDLQIADLSGEGVLRVISDLALHTAVLVMSASAGAWEKDALRNGAAACLRKPFGIDSLLALIDTFEHAGRRTPPWPGDVRQLSVGELDSLSQLPPEQLDSLPFGVIRLDSDGRIECFNSFEARASTYDQPKVIGRKFSDVAPCTSVRAFTEAFEQGFVTGQVDRVLRFIFPHHGARTVVSVRLYFDRSLKKLWIFVSKRRGEVSMQPSHEVYEPSAPASPVQP